MTSEKLAAEDLERSGITIEAADKAGMFPVEDASEIHEDFKPLPALVLPYLDPLTGEPMTYGDSDPFIRIRYLKEPKTVKSFIKKKPQRYGQPPSSGVCAYFPQGTGINWKEVYEDVETPILITEGEKKALRGCMAGIPTVGLGGVYNFMQDDALLPAIDDLCLEGRDFYICYDSDATSNTDIQAAEGKLATELSLHRGGRVFLVRLPTLKGQEKTGLDDFLLKKSNDAFFKLLESAPRMRKIDSAVMSLNESVAWIATDGLVYDKKKNRFIKKGDFISGDEHSALEIQVPTLKGNGVKRLSVAAEWLTHPHALRYQSVTFDPTTPNQEITDEEGRPSLNMWRGWDAHEGNVKPFLELSEFLFQELPDEQRDLPLNLMAYKAQNPGVKVPLALVLVGEQGCGKSLWARIIREAFQPYGDAVSSHALLSPFNGWVERSLICVIDEAQSLHLTKGADRLKNLISETRQYLNEKYRVARQVSSYTMYILTSNDRRVGAYSSDDRRMFVISAPRKREGAFYDKVGAWLEAGGARNVLGWLLDYDLKGWTPPKTAPMTAEKYMAYVENLTPIQRLAEEMKTADHNVVKAWIDASLEWAKVAEVGNNAGIARLANEIKSSLTRLQIRPFYTPEELAMMFPAIVDQLHGAKGLQGTPAGEISRQLREAGIPYLRSSDDPRGFKYRGLMRQYLVIAQPEDWAVPLSQNEFERSMKQFPDYGMFCAMLDKNRKRAKK